MTLAELAQNNGQNGRPAYVAVNGTIYDVTESPRWQNGQHPPDHQAGMDLTEELASAPHVRAVVERFPVVGTLEAEASAPTTGGSGKITVGIIIAAVVLAIVVFLLL
ncbi:MAG: cytochrome b5 domain-containing protein [Desulfuromonadales bacterium]|jgi:predicted heme/steroid binding protein